ncbi:hypothetical protein OUZ56_021664 [Daphnia magna]|uniref:Uncharacterized protein n=1 Tax=Daphnia magna TaxID=35525 RepID=A0ABR0AUB9_9CRUS|nr:hypothetical protein OUZ56_021664 [Daphnia magna]
MGSYGDGCLARTDLLAPKNGFSHCRPRPYQGLCCLCLEKKQWWNKGIIGKGIRHSQRENGHRQKEIL